jgi:hypothetical protein
LRSKIKSEFFNGIRQERSFADELQAEPGAAALTDGLDAIRAALGTWEMIGELPLYLLQCRTVKIRRQGLPDNVRKELSWPPRAITR